MDRLTGICKDTGIIEIIDSDIYEKLLKMESIYINDILIEMSRYSHNIIVTQDNPYKHNNFNL